MKNIKRILSGAITMAMVCSMATVFNGAKVQAKENIPKYMSKQDIAITEACMYEDKAIVKRHTSTQYLEGIVGRNVENELKVGQKISKEEMYYTGYKNEGFIYNFKDKTSVSTKSIEDNMEKVIENKYSSFSSIRSLIKSENGVYWGEFEDGYHKRRGVVSSKGDLIETQYKTLIGDLCIKVFNNTVYTLDNEKNTLNILTTAENKEYTIDMKEADVQNIYDLYVNSNGIYILRAVPNGKNGNLEYDKICKVQLKENKASLVEIAKHKAVLSPVTTDNNDNIWYLEDGLIYKVEDDKPILKYEVDKNAYNLFVSNDNNFIVSGDYPSNEWSTIVNLSDKYTDGWVKEDNKWYYYENRRCLSSEWKEIDGKWYSFNADGVMMTGWANDEIPNWYYLNDDGQMVTGWKEINGKWYSFNYKGVMMTGWVDDEMHNWYYLNRDGQMVTGWKEIDGNWYCFKDNGQAVKNWEKIDGIWYYFNNDCKMLKGWQKINGTWYYFYDNGSMAHDTTIEGYKIGHDGAML